MARTRPETPPKGLAAALLAGVLCAAAPCAARSGGVRMESEGFGGRMIVEVRAEETKGARTAAEAALETLHEIEHLTDGSQPDSAVSRLNAAAGREPLEVDPRLMPLLVSASQVCHWSMNAHGPLGGGLYALWGLEGEVERPPRSGELEDATARASCEALELDPRNRTARVAEGSRLALRGFRRGYAVDRAVETLRERGVENGWVEVPGVRRGFGPGPEEDGWPALLPVVSGFDRSLGEVLLQDQSLAVVSIYGRQLEIAGQRYAPWINQRTGRPAEDVVAVLVVTRLAVEAEAIATSLFLMKNREGVYRVGSLRPRPSVLWLLGSGDGQPLLSDYHWYDLRFR